ncbi:MAG: esterase family protein [Mogibacterium sp.]|nr:esterase family protein [Mogibacterium sp.]
MKETYYRQYSWILDREMEHVVFGERGKVCFAFAPQNGHVYDFKNFGMVETVRPWIEAGKLRVVCVDSIDEESWSNEFGDPRERIELQEHWFHYLTDELVPQFLQNGEKGMVTGCSMGGVHSGVAFFRRPDLFDTMISLSGLFDASWFFHDYMDDLVYANSPIHFLPNMPQDHPWIDLYNQGNIIICCGQGAWEDEMRRDAGLLDGILTGKGIRHWTDFWGYDVNHDWPWWRKQLPYFVGILLGEA